mmetsp:Transcript_20564/g.32365  ORF Transcript_20564/g.32365 Transcript_20564/m.32365 type:complete len:362 (-) Transcript_20564:1468-2553(-)
MFGPPTRLPKYLEQFAVDEEFRKSCVFPGPEISICKGVGSSPHQFLSSDGVASCSRCNDTLCPQCNEKIGIETFCLPCFAIESIVPQSGCSNSKSIAEMRQCLIGDNFDGAKDLQSDEVEDAYEMIEYLHNYRELEKSVKYPLYAADEMASATKWEELIEVDFKEGGAFLAEPGLGAKHIPGVLDLFASLVRFKESGKKTEWIKDSAVYDSLPSLFIKFADGSRVDSGYRLVTAVLAGKKPSLLHPLHLTVVAMRDFSGSFCFCAPACSIPLFTVSSARGFSLDSLVSREQIARIALHLTHTARNELPPHKRGLHVNVPALQHLCIYLTHKVPPILPPYQLLMKVYCCVCPPPSGETFYRN